MNIPRWAAGLVAVALAIAPGRAQTDGSAPGSAMGTHGAHRNGTAQREAAAAAAIMDRTIPRIATQKPERSEEHTV